MARLGNVCGYLLNNVNSLGISRWSLRGRRRFDVMKITVLETQRSLLFLPVDGRIISEIVSSRLCATGSPAGSRRNFPSDNSDCGYKKTGHAFVLEGHDFLGGRVETSPGERAQPS